FGDSSLVGQSLQRTASPRDPLPRQHRRGAVAERARAAAEGSRRAAGRLRALQAPPRGRRIARPARRAPPAAADPVARVRATRAPDRRLPLLLRAYARAEIPAIPALGRRPEALGDALPR